MEGALLSPGGPGCQATIWAWPCSVRWYLYLEQDLVSLLGGPASALPSAPVHGVCPASIEGAAQAWERTTDPQNSELGAPGLSCQHDPPLGPHVGVCVCGGTTWHPRPVQHPSPAFPRIAPGTGSHVDSFGQRVAIGRCPTLGRPLFQGLERQC